MQNELREKMGMEFADGWYLARIVLIAMVVCALAFFLSRAVASLFRLIRRWFYRIMPPRRANALSFVTVVVLLVIITRYGTAAAPRTDTTRQAGRPDAR